MVSRLFEAASIWVCSVPHHLRGIYEMASRSETYGEDEMNGAEATVLVAVALGAATAQIIAAVIMALLVYFTFRK